MLSPYSIFEVDSLVHDDLKKTLIETIFSILYALLLQNHIQSHIPNNYKVINKNKMSCNTPCPCLSSVWEQYFKILHNMHFDQCNLTPQCLLLHFCVINVTMCLL